MKLKRVLFLFCLCPVALSAVDLPADEPVADAEGSAHFMPLPDDYPALVYCERAHVRSEAGRAAVQQFTDGLKSLGLLSNLVDFAFFDAGMNTTNALMTWHSQVRIVGRPRHDPGGILTLNHRDTNWLYVTNLPPNQSRTLVAWLAQTTEPNASNNRDFASIMTMTGQGSPIPVVVGEFSFPDPAGAYGVIYDGTSSHYSRGRFLATSGDNRLSMFAISSTATNTLWLRKTGNLWSEPSLWVDDIPFGVSNAPVVIRFAAGAPAPFAPVGPAWEGLFRGFAYFNTALSSNQLLRVNSLLPKIGVVVLGDSKSEFLTPWSTWWRETPQNFGLFWTLTNDTHGGTTLSKLNSPGDSFQDRWPGLTRFKPNSEFPTILFALRGGQNDLGNCVTDAGLENAWTAATQICRAARTNGFRVLAWTLDRTSSLWEKNRDRLAEFNRRVRSNPHLYDYLVDAEEFFHRAYGETPFTNLTIYSDGVHETNFGSLLLGSNCVGQAVAPGLGH